MRMCRSVTLKSVVPTLVAGLIGITVAWHPGFAKGKPGGGTTAAYTYTDLGGFSGGSFVQSQAYAIGNPDAAGLAYIAGGSYAFPIREEQPALWGVTGTGAVVGLQNLGTLPGQVTGRARAVNDFGVTTGDSDYASLLGFVSVPGVGLRSLPTFGGSSSYGYGINNGGDIVGIAEDAALNSRGALWHVDAEGNVSAPEDLGNLTPYDINDLGVIVGQSAGVAAVAWFDTNGLQVHTIPGAPRGTALAINNRGDMVGTASDGETNWAFVCPANGSMTPLPDFGGDAAAAMSINDQGLVVGWAHYPRKGNTIRQVGVIWKNRVVTDLNKLASVGSTNNLHEALGINSAGQVTGTIYLNGISEIHGYVLTPR